MTRDEISVPDATTRSDRAFTRRFIVIALLLSVVAVASMVIAVTRPTSDASLLDYPQPGEVQSPPVSSSKLLVPALAELCRPGKAIRLMAPRHIQAARVCSAPWVGIAKPITLWNMNANASVFAELAIQLAQPDGSSTPGTVCSFWLTSPPLVAIRIGGQWYQSILPASLCGSATREVYQVLQQMTGLKS